MVNYLGFNHFSGTFKIVMIIFVIKLFIKNEEKYFTVGTFYY